MALAVGCSDPEESKAPKDADASQLKDAAGIADSDTRADASSGPDAISHSDSTSSHADVLPDSSIAPDAQAGADTESVLDAQADTVADAIADTFADTKADAGSIADAELDADAGADAKSDADTDASSDGDAAPFCHPSPIPGFGPPGPVKGFPVPTRHCEKSVYGASKISMPVPIDPAVSTGDSANSTGACLLARDLDGDKVRDLAWIGTDDGHRAVLRIVPAAKLGKTKPLSVNLGHLDCAPECANDCVAADVDGDGKLEIFIATAAGLRVVTHTAGGFVRDDELVALEARVTPAATIDLVDIDRDGDLDAYVGRYAADVPTCGWQCKGPNNGVDCAPRAGARGLGDLLLTNDSGKLTTVASHAGGKGSWSATASVSIGDPDRDGWPDVFVATRYDGAHWLRNDGSGGLVMGPAVNVAGLGPLSGSAMRDDDDDGRLDIVLGASGANGFLYGSGRWNKAWKSADKSTNRGIGTIVPTVPLMHSLMPYLFADRRQANDVTKGQMCDEAVKSGGVTSAIGPLSTTYHAASAANGPLTEVKAAATIGEHKGGPGATVFLLVGGDIRRFNYPQVNITPVPTIFHIKLAAPNDGIGSLVQLWDTLGAADERWVQAKTGRSATRRPMVSINIGDRKAAKLVVWFPSGKKAVINNPKPGTITVSEKNAAVTTIKPKPWPAAKPLPLAKPTKPPVVVAVDHTKLAVKGFSDVTAAYPIKSKDPFALCNAVADFDGDGIDDVAFISTGQSDMTVHVLNLGKGAAAAKVVQTTIPATFFYPSGSCAVLDADDDGKPDLVLSGSPGLALLRNTGGGKFKDESQKMLPKTMDWSAYSVTAGDFDGDGDVDLYAGALRGKVGCTNVACGHTPADFFCFLPAPGKIQGKPAADRLLIRDKALPFVDKTAAFKMPDGALSPMASTVDLDNDGIADVLIGDDFGSHRWVRFGSGKAVSGWRQLGFAGYAHAMGAALGDFNGDGLFDVWMTDIGVNAVYVRTVDGSAASKTGAGKTGSAVPLFHDVAFASGAAGLTRDVISWGPVVADFDHDGRDDVYLPISGWLPGKDLAAINSCQKVGKAPSQHDVFALSTGAAGKTGWTFGRAPESKKPELGPTPVSSAAVDIDGDGDLDIVQVRANQSVRLLRNDIVKKGKSIRVRLTGAAGNKLAIGAHVAVTGGGKRARFVANSGVGGGGAGSLHVGLGTSPSGKVTIRWPGKKGATSSVVVAAGKQMAVKVP